MLHKLNPVRLKYIREQIDHHWQADETGLKPLAGKSAADVGCGAGLLAEPLARLGAAVTGIDAAPENIAAARAHALGQGLEIDYRVGGAEALDGRYDLVTSLEVVEHVADPAAFVGALAAAVADGGLLILSTPNRTALVEAGDDRRSARGCGQIPKGTHDWDKFVAPDELKAMVRGCGAGGGRRDRARLQPDARLHARRGSVAQLSADGAPALTSPPSSSRLASTNGAGQRPVSPSAMTRGRAASPSSPSRS